MGRTRTNRIVNITSEPTVALTDLAVVRVVHASANSLIGELSATGELRNEKSRLH
jgi:hypothetical protein